MRVRQSRLSRAVRVTTEHRPRRTCRRCARARLGLTGDTDAVWGDFERIAIAAVSGDDDGARAVVVSAARILAAALVSATNVLDLDRIVLTGPAWT